MLNPMWKTSTCVNMLVTSCHVAPSLTPGSQVPPFAEQTAWETSNPPRGREHRPLGRSASQSTHRLAAPPVARMSTQIAALIPMIVIDTTPWRDDRNPPYGVRAARVSLRPSARQVGQWKPTAASRMQSGQIGRPHRWQTM